MSLLDYLDKNNIAYRLPGQDKHVSKKEGWIGLICPYCGIGSNRFHLGINTQTSACSCWRCGKLDAVKALSLICRISQSEALSLLGNKTTVRVDRQEHFGHLQIPKGVTDLQPPHRRYLEGRGFDPDEIARLWEVQAIGLAANLKWRLFIPIHDKSGRIVSWTTRSIGSVDSRYLFAKPEQEEIPAKTLLYGMHLARHSVIVVEGPIDAWAIGPGAVATMGIAYTPEQARLIAQYPVRAICFDSEGNALRAAEKMCRELSVMPGQTELIELESGKDAADCDDEEIEELKKMYLESHV